MLLAGERVTLGASIGVALSDGVSSPENLLRNADLAMYVAKRDRKGHYALFESDMHARASKRLQLRSQLEVALEEEQFELYFQPVVELDDLRVVGCEALLRWQRPGRGLVGPNQFIALCEQTGMILPLGSWVLRSAGTRGARWRREHPDHDEIFLSVNISPRQLLQDGFVDEVASVLRDTGAEAKNLVLEI